LVAALNSQDKYHDVCARLLRTHPGPLLVPSTVVAEVCQLVEMYADLPLGAVDASVIAVAERLRISEVATLDRRHFTVVRPNHTSALLLLPEKL
jgi:predicted nucleic acid-binding protein